MWILIFKINVTYIIFCETNSESMILSRLFGSRLHISFWAMNAMRERTSTLIIRQPLPVRDWLVWTRVGGDYGRVLSLNLRLKDGFSCSTWHKRMYTGGLKFKLGIGNVGHARASHSITEPTRPGRSDRVHPMTTPPIFPGLSTRKRVLIYIVCKSNRARWTT